MSELIVAVMAAAGIGGGFVILASEWWREERRLARARRRCSGGVTAFGVTVKVCDYYIFGISGVERGPNWRHERLVSSAEEFNRSMEIRRRETRAQLAKLQSTIDSLQGGIASERLSDLAAEYWRERTQ